MPSVICAVTVTWLDPYLDTGGESALFFVGVLLVGLLGGIAPAALSAVLSGLLLNYYLIAPRHSFTIAEPNSAITELVLLLIAVAVAVLVDFAAKRTREARRASQEAELLTLFAGSVLRGADLETLLERVRETYAQRSVSMLRESEDARAGGTKTQVVACVGRDPVSASTPRTPRSRWAAPIPANFRCCWRAASCPRGTAGCSAPWPGRRRG